MAFDFCQTKNTCQRPPLETITCRGGRSGFLVRWVRGWWLWKYYAGLKKRNLSKSWKNIPFLLVTFGHFVIFGIHSSRPVLNYFISSIWFSSHSVLELLCRFFPGHHRQDGWTSAWEKVKNMIIQISSKSIATFAIVIRIIIFYHQLPVWLPSPWGSLLWGFQRLLHKWIRSLSIFALSFVHFLTMFAQWFDKSISIFAHYFVQ